MGKDFVKKNVRERKWAGSRARLGEPSDLSVHVTHMEVTGEKLG